jgi:hypothetical protein
MTAPCFFCEQPIQPGDVNMHHPVYKSRGGTDTAASHRACHASYHSKQGDFREFGRIGGQISALSRRWAFNLKNVRTDPAHEINRSYYRAYYAH